MFTHIRGERWIDWRRILWRFEAFCTGFTTLSTHTLLSRFSVWLQSQWNFSDYAITNNSLIQFNKVISIKNTKWNLSKMHGDMLVRDFLLTMKEVKYLNRLLTRLLTWGLKRSVWYRLLDQSGVAKQRQQSDGQRASYRCRILTWIWFLNLDDGRYALIECKLGSGEIEDGAKHLIEIKRLIAEKNKTEKQIRLREADLMIVLTGGGMAYTCEDEWK